jgi:hypothetical protein
VNYFRIMRLSSNYSSIGNSVTSSSNEVAADGNSSTTTAKVSVPVPTMVRNTIRETSRDTISNFPTQTSLPNFSFGVLTVLLSLSLSLFRRIESKR